MEFATEDDRRTCVILLGRSGLGKSRRGNLMCSDCAHAKSMYLNVSAGGVHCTIMDDLKDGKDKLNTEASCDLNHVVVEDIAVIDLQGLGSKTDDNASIVRKMLRTVRRLPHRYLKAVIILHVDYTGRFYNEIVETIELLKGIDSRLVDYLRIDICKCPLPPALAILNSHKEAQTSAGSLIPENQDLITRMLQAGYIISSQAIEPEAGYQFKYRFNPPVPVVSVSIDGKNVELSPEDGREELEKIAFSLKYMRDIKSIIKSGTEVHRGFIKALEVLILGEVMSLTNTVILPCEDEGCLKEKERRGVSAFAKCGHWLCLRHEKDHGLKCSISGSNKLLVKSIRGKLRTTCSFCSAFDYKTYITKPSALRIKLSNIKSTSFFSWDKSAVNQSNFNWYLRCAELEIENWLK